MISKIIQTVAHRRAFLLHKQIRAASCSASSASVQLPYSYAFGKSDLSLDFLTLGQCLDNRAKSDPSRIAIHSEHEGISKTFVELKQDVDNLSAAFYNDFGLRLGDVIGLWSANCYQYLVIQYAAAKNGLILCTLNPVYKSDELQYALQKSGARLLFMPSEFTQQARINNYCGVFEKINMSATSLQHVVLMDGQAAKFNPKINMHFADKLIEQKGCIQVPDEVNSDDPAIIMFTSGTTGKPKGALLSHNNLVNNAFLTGTRLGLTRDIENTIACIPIPLFHIFGMVYGNVMMSRLGMKIVLPDFKYNVNTVIDAINKYTCTHIMMVPAMTVDILNHVERTNAKLPSLKTVITGSAPTPLQVAKNFIKQVPNVKEFLIRYGSTETGGCMTMPLVGDLPDKTIDNVGAPLDFVQIQLVDPKTKRIVKIGEHGELWARGHNVMLGYWKDEEKTKQEITESRWFKSGDLAVMDEHGRIKLIGRTKEIIIRGGENIYPKEVEELLHKHEAVQDAFVCGVPSKRLGEEICAWIKIKQNAQKPTEQDIINFCKDKISYFKVPRYVLFVLEFPRTPTGKAQKFEMTRQSIELLGLQNEQH